MIKYCRLNTIVASTMLGTGGIEQPFAVAWILMVHAVHGINNIFQPGTIGHKMKNEPVHDVFEQAPEKHTGKEQ